MIAYHVTSKRNGSLYGHSTEHCDESGCAGTEMFIGSITEYPEIDEQAVLDDSMKTEGTTNAAPNGVL